MPVIPVLNARNASNEHDNTGMQDNTDKPVNDKHDTANTRMNLNHTKIPISIIKLMMR